MPGSSSSRKLRHEYIQTVRVEPDYESESSRKHRLKLSGRSTAKNKDNRTWVMKQDEYEKALTESLKSSDSKNTMPVSNKILKEITPSSRNSTLYKVPKGDDFKVKSEANLN